MSLIKWYSVAGLAGCLSIASAGAIELTADETRSLQAAEQGQVARLGELWQQQRELPVVPVKLSSVPGAQLLLSDKPEYFYDGNGISLQEEVKPGVVRLYLYHVPEPAHGPRIISVVIENLSAKPLKWRFLRHAFPKPGTDYYRVGKAGLVDFFNSKPEKRGREIPPGGRALLDPILDQTPAASNQLVHAFYEFELNQPARISVFQRDPGQASLAVIDRLPRLPFDRNGGKSSGAGRGLFLTNEFTVANAAGFVLDTTNGPMRLMLADGRNETFITGRDGIEQRAPVLDSGNYGVLYHVRLTWKSSDGRGLALLMTKRGADNKYCVGQSAGVRVNGGIWPAGTVAVPSDRVYYGKPGEMVVIQKYAPPANGRNGVVEILYSPPGASCIPTPLVLAPY